MRRFHVFTAIIICLLSTTIVAEEKDESLLTIDRIFNSDEFRMDRFGPARWLENIQLYTTLEKNEKGYDEIVQYDPETGAKKVIVSASQLTPKDRKTPLEIDDYHWSRNESQLLIFTNTKRVWRANTRGDYWVLDLESSKLLQLGTKFEPSTLMFAKFSPQGDRVAYVMKNNLFVESLASGEVVQLTFDGSRTIINGTFDWVYEEEFDCRDGFRWSPDGSKIAYWQLDAEGVRDFYMINNTDSLYPRIIPVQYPKAGETNSAAKVGIVSASGGQTTWFDLQGDPRQHYIARMDWAANSSEILFQRLNRKQNTLWLIMGDSSDGSTRTVHTETDDAWVDAVDDLLWLNDGKHFIWVSEADGWRHVYIVSRSGEKRLVTNGEFDAVRVVKVDEKNGWIYYMASPDKPTQSYLYRSKLDGSGEAERISPENQSGFHGYQMSSDASLAIHSWSSFDNPTVTDLVKIPSHESIRTLISNERQRERISKLKRKPVEYFRLTIDDGIEVDAYCMKPFNFDPGKKYPVLVYVYSEPWGQTVRDRWGGRNYLWHLMLTQQGYLVMSFDNRGTPAPRGRAWRKSIYGKVGQLNSSDQAAAVRAAIKKFDYIDENRIASWGWSGGGSATLNALFRYPDLYHTGIAVAPVSDLRFYDTIYQERYTGIPQEVPENYEKGSPITYAHQLKGNLLIVHGTGDDNVHYQNAEAVINKLIEHNKPFSMMAYPNRSHGIYEGRNTTRHLFTLLTKYLKQNMPAGSK